MRIDIHTHTKKVKSGDAHTRNIDAEKFSDILKNTDVKIIAITNHNHFDLKQYEELRNSVVDTCQVWPGIELDIFEGGKRAHLLVIANPKNYSDFNNKISTILLGKDPEAFTISLKETIETFDALDCIYVAHYLVKKPNLGDDEIETLLSLVSNPKRVLKEATNSISAGIYISHGHNSIYGSDVHDWNDYVTASKELPQLRLPVESFEQFCLLLEKDEATINTILNKKVKETIELNPFSAAELIRLDIYNDINILFGSKGTGKTEILEALSKFFNSKGHKTSVYKSNDLHLNDAFDLRGKNFNANVSDFEIEECEEEIQLIKEATEEEVTSLSKYLLHFSFQETNKISQKLTIKNIPHEDETSSNRQLKDIAAVLEEFKEFKDYVEEKEVLAEYVSHANLTELETVLQKIIAELIDNAENKFFIAGSIKQLNKIVATFIKEVAKKTNQPPKPTKKGFAVYASNRLKRQQKQYWRI
jgi:hypothetical protein